MYEYVCIRANFDYSLNQEKIYPFEFILSHSPIIPECL